MSSRIDQYRNSLFGNDSRIVSDGSRESQLREYLSSRRITRATLSRRDLSQNTDVTFFVSSHFANLISFISFLGVAFCQGYMGWGRYAKGNYNAISEKYETLLTPVFWIIPVTWGLVLVAEAIYILFTFIKNFGHLPIVQHGIGFQFFFINCFQMAWLLSYCFDVIWLAFIFLSIAVFFLLWLNFNLYYQAHIDDTSKSTTNNHTTLPQSRPTLDEENINDEMSMNVFYEWLIFRLPFQLHLGWCIFLLIINLNEMSIALQWNFSTQITLVSLIILWLIGIFVLFYPSYPVFIIPVIISWVSAGVWLNIKDPSASIVKLFDEQFIRQIYGGMIATCIEHAIITTARFIYFFADKYQLIEKQ